MNYLLGNKKQCKVTGCAWILNKNGSCDKCSKMKKKCEKCQKELKDYQEKLCSDCWSAMQS